MPWQRVINSKGIISPRYALHLFFISAFTWRLPRKQGCQLCLCLAFCRVLLKLISVSTTIALYSSQPSGTQSQAAALRAEGVVVNRGALGELSVDLDVYGWFPERLPSQEREEGDEEEEEGTDEETGR